MSSVLDGILVAQKINEQTQDDVLKLKAKNINPHLAVILVGEDPASQLYVSIKEKKCQKLGIDFSKYLLPANITEQEILYLIDSLNKDEEIHSIIIQLPLPKQFDSEKIINHIDSKKDADALTKKAIVNAPTAAGIVEMLRFYGVELENKKIVIVGYGKLVGKPLEKILKNDYKDLNIIICDSKTNNLSKITKSADIIISAVGKPHLITQQMVKNDVVIVDAGTSETNGEITGDVDWENLQNIASFITPVKGGVGPITVAKLLENVVTLTKKQNNA